MALELRRRGFIDGIFPVFVGDKRGGDYAEYVFKGANACHPSFLSPNDSVCVERVEAKVQDYVTTMGMGCPYELRKTVQSILTDITKCQGLFLTGKLDDGLTTVASEISEGIRELKSKAENSSDESSRIAKLMEENENLKSDAINNRILIEKLLEENNRLKAGSTSQK